MVRGFALLLLLVPGIVGLSLSQDERAKATRVVPLYCYTDILRGFDSTCVDRVRVTFRNGDDLKIRHIRFRLIIVDLTAAEDSILYDAKHEVAMTMNTLETSSADIRLLNPIPPPEGRSSFSDRSAWRWEVSIISLNRP